MRGASAAPPPPPSARGKLAPPPKPAAAQPAQPLPEPGHVPGTSDVTEIRPPQLADADDDEQSGEFAVDDEELIDDQSS